MTLRTFPSQGRLFLRALPIAVLALALGACGRSSRLPGVSRLSVNVLAGHLYASLVSEQLRVNEGLTFPIPGISGATLSLSPDFETEGSVIQVSVPLEQALSRGRGLPLLPLPDGRAIPGVETGALPRSDLRLGPVDLSLFIARDVFGLFLPLKLVAKNGAILSRTMSFEIRDSRGNRAGRAYAVSAREPGAIGGLLILMPFVQTKGGSL